MATTMYFSESVKDQGNKNAISLEVGRSSHYAEVALKDGQIGEDSIYLTIDEKHVVMDRKTAKSFVESVISLGRYFDLVD